MHLTNSKKILFAGFASVTTFMVLLAAVGLAVVNTSMHRIETFVYSNNQKVELITRMRTLARERTVCLQKMLLLQDPFYRDSEWLAFNRHAGEFVSAREALLKMDLSPAERELIDGPNALVASANTVQHEVAELIFQNRSQDAHDLMVSKVVPLQDGVFDAFTNVIATQEAQAKSAADQVEIWYERSLAGMLILALGAIVTTVFIVRYVIRHTSTFELELQNQKERAEVTLHSIGDGVIVADAQGNIEQLNVVAEHLLEITSEEAVGKSLAEQLSLGYRDSHTNLRNPIERALQNGDVSQSDGDSVLARPDGRELPVEFTVAPIFDSARNISGAVLVFRDVSVSRTLARQLEHQALHDSLTGLVNRRAIEARLKQALAESKRYADEEYWLCYIDLDQFKVINDTCGHMAGDALLKQVAEILQHEVRETDLVARMGGDEFAILLKRCGNESVKQVVERIRLSMESQRFAWDRKSFNCTASIGLVALQQGYGNLYDLLSAADSACYMAKERGRNRTYTYKREDDAIARMEGEMQWVHRINHALEEGRLVLFYQSIFPLRGPVDKFRCEVMVRMLDERGNLVPPMAFIPAAERYNRMIDIDRWVVRNVLAFFAASGMTDYSVSINLSAQSLGSDGFHEFLLEELSRHAVDPRSICFEITETSAIANLSRALSLMSSLKAKGCRFSLDDFGSGLSSFGYLKNLPVDYLKIDGSFVRDILDDPIDRALVEAINQVGHILGMRTIAEYVENDEIRAVLEQIAVDYGQGYGLSKPAPIAELLGVGMTRSREASA